MVDISDDTKDGGYRRVEVLTGPVRRRKWSDDDKARIVARWAAVASLVETCKLNGIDPQRYFTDVLTRLVNGWPNSRIDELMPWCWAAADKA
jgi:hypothetical protein